MRKIGKSVVGERDKRTEHNSLRITGRRRLRKGKSLSRGKTNPKTRKRKKKDKGEKEFSRKIFPPKRRNSRGITLKKEISKEKA